MLYNERTHHMKLEIRDFDIALCLLQLDVLAMAPTKNNKPAKVRI